jgi:hypothetical protein
MEFHFSNTPSDLINSMFTKLLYGKIIYNLKGRWMRKLYLILLCLVILENPLHASFSPQFSMVPMVEEILHNWAKETEIVPDLKTELIRVGTDVACDIVSKTCGLCDPKENSHEKASVAMTFTMYDKNERDQVAGLAWGLKRHFVSLGRPLGPLEIVDALFVIPAYQRSTIYKRILEQKTAPSENLSYLTMSMSRSFGILEKLSMQLFSKTSWLFPDLTNTVVNPAPVARYM